MCTTCGCGDTSLVPVDVHEKILAGNDRVAQHNREHFAAAGVLALNLMGSPGAGKTALMTQILCASSKHGGVESLAISLELDGPDMDARLASWFSNTPDKWEDVPLPVEA